MVQMLDPVQTDFPQYQGSRYPAAAHSLLPYNPAALSGADLFTSLATSPAYGVAKLASRTLRSAQLRGLGADPVVPPGVDPATVPPSTVPSVSDLPVEILAAVAGVGVLVLVAMGLAAHEVGKAVAPEGEESTYGWYGVGAGLLGGPLGLGVLALVGGRNREG